MKNFLKKKNVVMKRKEEHTDVQKNNLVKRSREHLMKIREEHQVS